MRESENVFFLYIRVGIIIDVCNDLMRHMASFLNIIFPDQLINWQLPLLDWGGPSDLWGGGGVA